MAGAENSNSGGSAGSSGSAGAGATAGADGGANAATGGTGPTGTGGQGAGGADGGTVDGGGSGGGVGSGGAGGGPACDTDCGPARECCDGTCVNLQNDPLNCGTCGRRCSAEPYCGDGECGIPACFTTCTSGTCCGTSCCSEAEICCQAQAPVSRVPYCQEPDNRGSCSPGCAPLCVCASPDTPIATPSGARRIADLAVGDPVYSVDHGRMVAVPVASVRRNPAANHRVVRLELDGGVTLEISPLHPTADGRLFGELRTGEALDGVRIRRATMVAYQHDATYDVLPASDTGAYFAGGVLIGSTLAAHPARVATPTAPTSVASPRHTSAALLEITGDDTVWGDLLASGP